MNTNSNFEKIVKSTRKSHEEFEMTTKRKVTQKRGGSNKRYAGWDNADNKGSI